MAKAKALKKAKKIREHCDRCSTTLDGCALHLKFKDWPKESHEKLQFSLGAHKLRNYVFCWNCVLDALFQIQSLPKDRSCR